jgi:hypothetical protein
MQSRDTDIITVLRDLLFDDLVGGAAYYKVVPSVDHSNIKIKVRNPLNTFVERNMESPYIKDSPRCVFREWMTKNEILNVYGKEMSKDDIKLLEDKWTDMYDTSMYYVRLHNRRGVVKGLDTDAVVIPGYPTETFTSNEYIPVYDVEWVEVDENFVMQRYNTIRIGEEIYILRGVDENVIRSRSNPTYCGLSTNGICFLNRSNKPYSLVLACAHL